MQGPTPGSHAGQILSDTDTFTFACHPGVPCYTRCCRGADMYLYPYDVIRLKNRLGMDSDAFLERHTETALRDNPYFPSVMLKMTDADDAACPFLTAAGCTVYEDRPFSCRAYPIERGVGRSGAEGRKIDFYSIARHDHCKGHREKQVWTVGAWLADQGVADYNAANDLWVDVDSLFRKNPWGEKGLASPAFGMAFMACFNSDRFRRFVFESTFLSRFEVAPERLDQMKTDDAALMRFGFDWVRFLLTGAGTLTPKA
ncbi:MAG: YkgJ family cysteine cluster protein [Pseudomonadota bacterium]